jgi:hypothetical protein
MNGTKGYVDPLLTALTVDYSTLARANLIGAKLFPRVPVDKPSGVYAEFDKENAMRVVDDTFGDNGMSKKATMGGKMVPYKTTQHGLHDDYDLRDAEKREGPFALKDKQIVDRLTTQLEINQEYRIAKLVQSLTDRFTALAGTGTAAGNKWASGGGDPFAAINTAIGKCFMRPNLMIVAGSVFDALEYHPILLAKLGESNMIKKVAEDTLAKLFRVDQVVIATGKADASKKKEDNSLTLADLWGASLILAYVDSRPDVPSAGKTLVVNYPEADGSGYIVRSWDDERAGLLGRRYVQVGHDVDEHVVCKDLIYTIKDTL